MAFGRCTRHALQFRRSPPTLMPASKEKNPAQRTVLVSLEQIAAFDDVENQQLLDCVFNSNIPAKIRRWLHKYMQNRRSIGHFQQGESKDRKV